MRNRLILVSLLFFLAACGPTGTAVQPTLDAEVVEQAVNEGIKVTFNGEECIGLGPAALPVGEYVFVFKSLLEKSTAELHVSRLTDGHTFQDILDIQGGDSRKWIESDWNELVTRVDVDWDISTGEKRTTYLLEEGEHAVFIGNALLTGSFEQVYCYPIMVVEASSE